MGAKDYYQILGVSETADKVEIKKKYRQLAKQYHPDANPGNKEAEERFKNISEAYEILSDPQKRAKYDQMRKFGAGGRGLNFDQFDFNDLFNQSTRSRGSNGRGPDIFHGLGDIFSQFFDLGESTRQKRYGPRKGENIHVDLTIPFQLAMDGGKASFAVQKEKKCKACNGGGAKPGSRVEKCPDCKGLGRITIGQGGFGVSRPCPKCYGKGQIIHNPCQDCHGSGEVRGKKTYNIKIAPGTVENKQIRLKGQGKPGLANGPKGDMIVKIHVQCHKFFQIEGEDVKCEVPINLKQAVNGTKIRIKTINRKKVQMTIPAGIENGRTFRLNGMGIHRNGKQGDQFVTIRVDLPDNPSEEEKEMLEQWKKITSN